MAGHMEIEKTKSRILEMPIWYNIRNTCEEHVKGRAVCNRQKKGCAVCNRQNKGCAVCNRKNKGCRVTRG